MAATNNRQNVVALRNLVTGEFFTNELARVVPRHVTPERLTRVVLAEATRTTMLYSCMATERGRQSLIACIMLAGELGLEPASPLGHFYMIPRNIKGTTQCTHLIGYKGLCELARRSGFVKRINADIVYQDEIDMNLFSCAVEPPEIHHKWSPMVDRNPDNIVCAYAVAELSDGNIVQVVLTLQDIEHRRSRSAARRNGPWQTDYAAMARKSALRALLGGGLVPLSAEMSRALHADDEEVSTPAQTVIDITSEGEDIVVPDTGTGKLRAALGISAQQVVVEEPEPEPEPEQVAEAVVPSPVPSPVPKPKKRKPRKKAAPEPDAEVPVAAGPQIQQGDEEPPEAQPEEAPRKRVSAQEQYEAFDIPFEYADVVKWCVHTKGSHPDVIPPLDRGGVFYELLTPEGRKSFEDFMSTGSGTQQDSLPF
jgi:recombination protein RecT